MSTPPGRYFTYIVASRARALYIGFTANLVTRTLKHKTNSHKGFTSTYRCTRLVWFEQHATPETAIAREKQLKGWRRDKKIALIEATNKHWLDLAEGWG